MRIVSLRDVVSSNEFLASSGYTSYNGCMKCNLRNVLSELLERYRRPARERGVNLNEAAIEALTRDKSVTPGGARLRDLADIAGTWCEDPAFDRALVAQGTIDEEV